MIRCRKTFFSRIITIIRTFRLVQRATPPILDGAPSHSTARKFFLGIRAPVAFPLARLLASTRTQHLASTQHPLSTPARAGCLPCYGLRPAATYHLRLAHIEGVLRACCGLRMFGALAYCVFAGGCGQGAVLHKAQRRKGSGS